MKTIIVKDVRRFIIRDREAGNEIVRARTLQQAMEILKQFEDEDKEENIYTENFYEIYDTIKKEII